MNTELEAVAEFLTGNQTAAATLPWRALGGEDLRVVRRWAGEALPLPAEKRLLRQLRRVIRFAEIAEGGLSALDARPALLRTHRRHDAAISAPARPARLLLESCRAATDATAGRDCAIVSLLLLAGLRRQEIVVLRRGDYDDADGRIEVMTPRGGRRSVLLAGECRGDIEGWLAERGDGGGPLFLAYSASGAPVPRGITGSTVSRVVARRCAEAGIEGLTPTLLRARFLRQLQGGTRQGAVSPCRYYLGEDGQPGWALSSLAAV